MTMKKKILSAAVLAALGAGTAQAVNLGNDGTGQVLLFPYYTVQGGEETVLSVVNTTDYGKAVKIRFREAYNSREVLDFNIFLSPWDVWTGKVQDSGEGGAAIISNDKTCTVPLSISEGVAAAFRPFAYDGTAAGEFEDAGPQGDIGRTNEGYVEIIEMGVMDPSLDSWVDGIWDNDEDDIPDYLHKDGVPNNCAGISSNYGDDWSASDELNTEGFSYPMGGMFGSLAIINVQTGTEISVNATALDDVFNSVVHYSTGSNRPNFNDAKPISSVVRMNNMHPGPELVTTDFYDGVDAVSSVLMADSVMNEYTVNPNVAGETAWVVTFPTKWAYADLPYDSGTGEYATGMMPFTSNFNAPKGGEACEEIGVIAYDREEKGLEAQEVDFSPAPTQPGIFLCYEANVIQLGDSNVMSAENTVLTYSNLPGKNGWIDLDMTEDDDHYMYGYRHPSYSNGGPVEAVMPMEEMVTFYGLPAIGFSASVLGNTNVGVGAAYGTSNSHVYHRTTTTSYISSD